MADASELIRGFEPETPLEAAVASDPELVEGLAWGKPRAGHPEGSVGAHVADLLATIDREGFAGQRRADLRLVALIHDSFKYRVRDWLPKTGDNHHANRARRFAEGYIDDPALLATVELHDRPYAIWRKMRRKGQLDEARFEDMMSRVPDPELFLRFIELDGSTEGKKPEPIRWFRDELVERGILDERAAEAS